MSTMPPLDRDEPVNIDLDPEDALRVLLGAEPEEEISDEDEVSES